MGQPTCVFGHQNLGPTLLQMAVPKVGTIDLARCSRCGLVQPLTPVSVESLTAFYQEDYFRSASFGYADYLKFNAPEMMKRGARMARTHAFLRGGSRVLDVGCATGHFLKGFKDHFAGEVYGVEISAWGSKYAQDHFRLNVFQGELKEARYPDRSFDLVHMADILEHTPHPVQTMEEVKRIMKIGGRLLLALPNGELDLKPLLRRPRSDQMHLYFFPRAVVEYLLAQTGFKVTKFIVTGFESALRDLGLLPPQRTILAMSQGRKGVFRIPPKYRSFARQKADWGLSWLASLARFGHQFEVEAVSGA